MIIQAKKGKFKNKSFKSNI